MIRIKADFDDVSAECLYNVLHDGEYRSQWDERMIEGFEIGWLSPNSDIGYYSIKSPKPLKNREFVTQRCWLDLGANRDKIIFNHSINHVKHPPKKGFVRGISYLTAYYIRPVSASACTVFYITQSDPGGSLPTWIVNMTSKVIAPKVIKKMHKHSLKYDKWKAKNRPNYMPWIHPDQITAPRVDLKDIDLSGLKADFVDESQIEMENNDDTNDNDE